MRVYHSVLSLAVVFGSGCLINTELYDVRREELLAAAETAGTYGVKFVTEPDCILVDASDLVLDGPFSFDAYLSGPNPIPQHDIWPVVVWPGHFALYQDPFGYTIAGPADDYGPSSGASTTKSIVSTGRTHVAVNYGQNGNLSLYIDGELKAVAPVEFSGDPAPNLYIGCWPDQEATFAGTIGEVRLSDSALYADEFEPDWEPYEVSQSTVGLWHLDEGQGSDVFDETGRHDGELIGGSWEHFYLGAEQ